MGVNRAGGRSGWRSGWGTRAAAKEGIVGRIQGLGAQISPVAADGGEIDSGNAKALRWW